MNTSAFRHLGLSEKSTQVYVALLALGTAAIKDIALKAGLKRPTVYLHIAELIEQGLVEKYPAGKKEYFKATDPTQLEKRAEENLAAVKQLMPQLTSLQHQIAGRPQVSVLEGRRGLEQVYAGLFEANFIRFWSDLQAVETSFKDYFYKITEVTAEKQIKTHEIIANTPEAKKSSRRYAAAAGTSYAARLATKNGIYNDSVIYGETLALFRLHANNLFVVVIKDPTIVSTMKVLFDMAWESAEPFIGR
jgi:sugar-specific transcriptional regulator TrmB